MKLDWLRILDALQRSRSLSEAAQRLHKTQPALSMSVKKIEQDLGFAVVNRDAYRFSLTQQGLALCRRAQFLLKEVQELNDFSQELATGHEPTFHVCYEQSCVNSRISHVLGQCYHSFKRTEFVIESGRRFSALERVNEGKADIGIGPWFDIFYATGDLETLPIGRIEVGLVASSQLIANPTMTYKQLQSFPCIAMHDSELWLESQETPYLNQRAMMKFDDFTLMRSALKSGAGWALMSLNLCKNEIAAGELNVIRLSDREDSFSTQIRAFRRHGRHHGPVANDVWEKFRAFANE